MAALYPASSCSPASEARRVIDATVWMRSHDPLIPADGERVSQATTYPESRASRVGLWRGRLSVQQP